MADLIILKIHCAAYQLTVVGAPMEVGHHVQLPVEEVAKEEAEDAITLIQPMVVVLVVDHQVKLNPAILTTVLVRHTFHGKKVDCYFYQDQNYWV